MNYQEFIEEMKYQAQRCDEWEIEGHSIIITKEWPDADLIVTFDFKKRTWFQILTDKISRNDYHQHGHLPLTDSPLKNLKAAVRFMRSVARDKGVHDESYFNRWGM